MRLDSDDCSDAELVRAAGADAAAFGVLYERHALRVYAWSRRRLEWAASDLTAETFAQAWLGRHRFRDEQSGSALRWLFGIARNVLRETVRLDRVEARARERLGLPLDLAAEEGVREGRRTAFAPSKISNWTRGFPADDADAPVAGAPRSKRNPTLAIARNEASCEPPPVAEGPTYNRQVRQKSDSTRVVMAPAKARMAGVERGAEAQWAGR